jgi:hypothetical protein
VESVSGVNVWQFIFWWCKYTVLRWSGFHIYSRANFSLHLITSEQPKASIVSVCFFMAVYII